MSGKTIMITGASSGFGAACARAFAVGQNRLILAARRQDSLQKLYDELSGKVPVHIIVLDVRNHSAVAAAVAGLTPLFQEIDLLVNNAGLALGLEPANRPYWRTGKLWWIPTSKGSCTAPMPYCLPW